MKIIKNLKKCQECYWVDVVVIGVKSFNSWCCLVDVNDQLFVVDVQVGNDIDINYIMWCFICEGVLFQG